MAFSKPGYHLGLHVHLLGEGRQNDAEVLFHLVPRFLEVLRVSGGFFDLELLRGGLLGHSVDVSLQLFAGLLFLLEQVRAPLQVALVALHGQRQRVGPGMGLLAGLLQDLALRGGADLLLQVRTREGLLLFSKGLSLVANFFRQLGLRPELRLLRLLLPLVSLLHEAQAELLRVRAHARPKCGEVGSYVSPCPRCSIPQRAHLARHLDLRSLAARSVG